MTKRAADGWHTARHLRIVRGAHSWWRRFAPEPARSFPSERAWSIAFRTAHIIAFSVVLGGYVWGIDPGRVMPVVALASLTGFGLAGLELYKSLHWLFLGKGLVVLVKLALLTLLPFAGDAGLPLLLAVVVLASVGAHMPSRYRHYSVLLGRVMQSAPRKPSGPLRSGTGRM